jgi:hypothetical protein
VGSIELMPGCVQTEYRSDQLSLELAWMATFLVTEHATTRTQAPLAHPVATNQGQPAGQS